MKKKRRRKQVKLKADVKRLLKKFDHSPKLKKGDLVLVAEVMRVITPEWGVGHWQTKGRKLVEVATIFPTCSACTGECSHPHIMSIDKSGGQQTLMKLKEEEK